MAQSVVGLINAGKAKREAKELARTRPKREISPLYGENLSLAESELAGGMSQAAEAAYANQLDKSTAGSLSAILRGGGSVNNVADIFAGGEEGRQRLALLNDQLRLSQIDTVMKARDMMGQETDKNFIFNDWMPWADKSQANAEARKGANDAIWSGLGTVAGAGMNMLGGGGGRNGSVSSPTTNASESMGALLPTMPSQAQLTAGTSPAATLGNRLFAPAISAQSAQPYFQPPFNTTNTLMQF